MHRFLEKKAISLYEPVLAPLLRGLRQEVLALAHISTAQQKAPHDTFPTHILLDCCCGAGGFLRLATEKKTQSFENIQSTAFIGLDMHPLMLNEAQKNAPQAHLLRANALHIPLQTQSVTVATLCMALHTMPLTVGQGVVHELLRVAKKVIIADYCLAERNITVPSTCLARGVEWLIGGEHYANYKIFMEQGGLEGFLYNQGLSPLERRSTLGGAGQVVILRKY